MPRGLGVWDGDHCRLLRRDLNVAGTDALAGQNLDVSEQDMSQDTLTLATSPMRIVRHEVEVNRHRGQTRIR